MTLDITVTPDGKPDFVVRGCNNGCIIAQFDRAAEQLHVTRLHESVSPAEVLKLGFEVMIRVESLKREMKAFDKIWAVIFSQI